MVITNQSTEFGSGPATIAAYSIGPKGDLAPIPGSPFLSSDAFAGITIDQTAGYKIGKNGALTPLPNSPFATGRYGGEIVIKEP